MIKQFLKDSFFYSFANILSRGILFLLLPLYTRVLSPGDYGIIDILTIFGALVNIVVTLEIFQGLARSYSDVHDESEKIAYSSTALWFTLCAYAFFAFIAFFFSRELASFLLDSLESVTIFQVAMLSFIANGIFYLLHGQLRWQLRSKNYAIVSIVFTLITTGASAILVLIIGLGILGIFYGQIAGAIAGSIISWLFARDSFKLLFFWNKCKEMLMFSLPLVLSSINVFIMLYTDRVAIKKLMTISDVGIYGIGYRFASIVGFLMVGINLALTPLIYSKYSAEATRNELVMIFRYFLAIALPLIMLISLFSQEFLWLFTTPQYYNAWSVMPILAAAILLSNMYIFMPGLDIAKKTKNISTINITAAISNIALNFILIPFLGIVGAALASLVSSFVMFSMYAFLSQKYYFVPHNWHRIGGATIVSIFTILLSLICFYYFDNYSITTLSILFKISATIIGSGIVLCLLIDSKKIKNLKAYGLAVIG